MKYIPNNLKQEMDDEDINPQDLAEASSVNISYILRLMDHDGEVKARNLRKVIRGMSKLAGRRYTKRILFPNH